MKKIVFLAIAAAFTFTACKDTKAEATTKDGSATEMNANTEDHSGHDHVTETPVASPTATAEGVKLNPAHGEPGHRCELPVGAPLDGSGGVSTTPQAAAQPVNNSQGFLSSGNAQPQAQAAPQATPAQQTAPGMQGKPNPAHGQPGHRCDVQVGQPLP